MSGSGRRPSQLPGSGLEIFSDVREWSGSPPRCPGVVGKALPDVREWSGGPHGCLGVAGSHSQTSVKSREALLEVLEGSESHP